MTRTFSDGHPKFLPACNFLSQYYFYNIFLQKSCRFSLQTLTKFEVAKTGSGVGFLRLTAVCVHIGSITSRCSGKEPALLPRDRPVDQTKTRHERAAEIEPTVHIETTQNTDENWVFRKRFQKWSLFEHASFCERWKRWLLNSNTVRDGAGKSRKKGSYTFEDDRRIRIGK